MTRLEFLQSLEAKLKAAKVENAADYLDYYTELIDDKTEALGNEEAAVASMENIDTIVLNAVLDSKSVKDVFTEKMSTVKEKVKDKGKNGFYKIISLVSSPFWVPILTALICAGIAVYIAILAVVIALFACELAFGCAGLAGIIGSIYGLICGGITLPSIIAYFGAGLILSGFCILFWKPVFLIAKHTVKAKAIKKLIAKL